jgi:CRP-like cAMP-binding protein
LKPLFDHIKTFLSLSKGAEEALSLKLQRIEIKKGDFLIRENAICQHLYFLESGCIRAYYYLDSKEVTHWFGFENDFVTSFHSFITRKPSLENIQVLEDAVLWSIGKDSLELLYNEFPEIERLGRKACEQYYIRLEDRYVSSQFKTASDRYLELIETKAEFLQRIPLGYIASYLGISQETLSRIRAKKI